MKTDGDPSDPRQTAEISPGEVRHLTGSERPTALRISDALRNFVDFVGRWASWLFVPMIVITVFDVTARKLVWIQIWLVENFGRIFESTLLQELEWHFHTGLFALVLGYGFIYNAHVRVDLVREQPCLPQQRRWLEFLGYHGVHDSVLSAIIIWFALEWVHTSYDSLGDQRDLRLSGRHSAYRWAIKIRVTGRAGGRC